MKELLLGLALLSQPVIAQTNLAKPSKTVEFETDPIAFALKGYSFHRIQVVNRFRFDAGIFGIEQPSTITGNKGYTTMTRGFGLKVNYLFSGVRGLYAGLDCGYAANNVKEIEGGKMDKGHNLSFGAHAGYRVFLFPDKKNYLSGLYVTPWAGISYNYIYDKVKFAGYKESNMGFFATLHIGYRL